MTDLGEMLRLFRKQHEYGVREMAEEIGLSTATYSRVERGYPCDMETFVRLLEWMVRGQRNDRVL